MIAGTLRRVATQAVNLSIHNYARSSAVRQFVPYVRPHPIVYTISKHGFSDNAAMANKILEKAKSVITDDLKKEINAMICFNISGKKYLMDAHSSRPLKIELVEELPEKVDVTLTIDEETFIKMAKGQVKPTSAFMSGKMKIKGNISVAMKAEKVFKAVKVE